MRATLDPRGSAVQELAIGSVMPLHEVGAIAFATPEVGYALGGPIGYVYPLKTINGGRTWRVDGDAFFLPTADAPEAVSEIVAPSADEAYAYGGPGGGSVVDVTTDGGAQWWSASLGQGLETMSQHGSHLWALAAGTTSSSAMNAQPSVWLYDSSNGGRTWTYRSAMGGVLGWEADLARPSASMAFALVKSYRNDVPGDEHLVATTDGGRSWMIRDDPCNTKFAGEAVNWTERLQASSTRSLWLFCGSEPGTGEQAKLVERSDDGGQSWKIVASHMPGEHVSADDVPLEGTLPDSGTTGSLTVTSSSDATILLAGNNALLTTDNGGQSWKVDVSAAVEQQFPQRFSIVDGTMFVKTQNALWRRVRSVWNLVAGSPKPY